MGRRPLKNHVQQELPKTRQRDKNGQFRGGARKGAGRPKRPISEGRASERHGAAEASGVAAGSRRVARDWRWRVVAL